MLIPFHELVVYLVFVVGFALTPGPNMMLYLAHTFESGRKAGWATVAGITTAFLFHIAATLLGLSALLIASPHALDVLRYLGIVYLLWLAWKNLRAVAWKSSSGTGPGRSPGRFYFRGLIGNLLNPGTLMLYFSLIPQFIHPERGQVIKQNLVLCGWQMIGSTVTNVLVVLVAGFATETFFRNEKNQLIIRRIMSGLIVVFAVKMLFWK